MKKCPECQFEKSKFGTHEYEPHAPGCSRVSEPHTEEWEKEFDEKFGDNFVYWQEILAEVRIGDADFKSLKAFIKKTRSQALEEGRTDALREAEAEVNNLIDPYPVDIFTEPPKGWQNKLANHCEREGYPLDRISAYYARWQRKVTKDDILLALSNLRKV